MTRVQPVLLAVLALLVSVAPATAQRDAPLFGANSRIWQPDLRDTLMTLFNFADGWLASRFASS